MTEPKPDHPLLISDVMRRAGIAPVPTEAEIWVDCARCHRHQSLDQASIEPGEDPQDITVYRCLNGCEVVAGTGYPSPIPLPDSGRYRLGDFVIWSSGGMEMKFSPPE